MRILHLVDYPPPATPARGAGDAGVLAAAAVRDATPGYRHSLCLVGGSAAGPRAAACGFGAAGRIAAPLGRTGLAAAALRAFVADRGGFQAVQCWSGPAAALAWSALGRRARIVVTPLDAAHEDPGGGSGRGGIVGLGLAGGAALGLALRPAPVDRAAIRARAGVAPDEPLVFLLGGAGIAADAHRFMFLTSLPAAAGTGFTVLVPRGAAQAARAFRLQRRSGYPRRVLATDLPLPRAVGTADIAVLEAPASGAAAVAIAAAHRAGVPVVTHAGAASPGLFDDALRAGAVAPQATTMAIGRCLTDLMAGPGRLRAARESLAAMRAGPSPLAEPLRRAWEGGASAQEQAA